MQSISLSSCSFYLYYHAVANQIIADTFITENSYRFNSNKQNLDLRCAIARFSSIFLYPFFCSHLRMPQPIYLHCCDPFPMLTSFHFPSLLFSTCLPDSSSSHFLSSLPSIFYFGIFSCLFNMYKIESFSPIITKLLSCSINTTRWQEFY